MKYTVQLDMAKYPHLVFDVEKAISFLEAIGRRLGFTMDLEEARRIVSKFDEYYEISWRRSNGYVIIPKNSKDAIYGRVVVHKIRLLRQNGTKLVELIIDRRVPNRIIDEVLREIGFDEIEYVQIE